MLHPHTEVRRIDERIGYGVFATARIPKGTVVWVQDQFDRVYTEAEVRALPPVYQEILEKYCFRNCAGGWVFCWDITRFVNHSFRPTCLTTPYGFEIAVVDIEPGQEITNDYGCFNIIEPFECFPEQGCDRTVVMPDDLLRHAEQWDAQLADAFPFLHKLAQPLADLLAPATLAKVQRIAAGEEPLDSIRCCYYNPALRSHADA